MAPLGFEFAMFWTSWRQEVMSVLETKDDRVRFIVRLMVEEGMWYDVFSDLIAVISIVG